MTSEQRSKIEQGLVDAEDLVESLAAKTHPGGGITLDGWTLLAVLPPLSGWMQSVLDRTGNDRRGSLVWAGEGLHALALANALRRIVAP